MGKASLPTLVLGGQSQGWKLRHPGQPRGSYAGVPGLAGSQQGGDAILYAGDSRSTHTCALEEAELKMFWFNMGSCVAGPQ